MQQPTEEIKPVLFFYRDRNDIPKVSLSLILFRDSMAQSRIKQFAKKEINALYVHYSMIPEYSPKLSKSEFRVAFISQSEFKAAEIKAAEGWLA